MAGVALPSGDIPRSQFGEWGQTVQQKILATRCHQEPMGQKNGPQVKKKPFLPMNCHSHM